MRVKHSDWALKADEAKLAESASHLQDEAGRTVPSRDVIDLLRKLNAADLQEQLYALMEYLDVSYIPPTSRPVKGKVVKNESC